MCTSESEVVVTMQKVDDGAFLSLVEQAVSGDERAFTELVVSCQSTLYAAALAVTRNHQDAMDAMQEGALRAWKYLGGLRNQAYFKTWITRIVIRTASSIVRKRRGHASLDESVAAKSEANDLQMDVRSAVERLDEKIRLCTVLHYFEDMPVAEVARVLRVREGTVKSRLHRARSQLKGILEGYSDDK